MSEQIPRVTIPNTEVRTLQSNNVSQEYRLFVSLPDGYHDSEDTYPVLYIGDGNWGIPYFASVNFKWHPVPPMIVVGIGYPTDDNDEISRLRERDFLPTPQKNVSDSSQTIPKKGGSPQFLEFIRDELIEFINNQYRTKPNNRIFFGYSFGGTFGIYTLFNQPNIFTHYIIGAPVLSWENDICLTYERDYADKHSELPVKLYLGVGTLDEDLMEQLVSFQATMQSRTYEGLEMHFEVFDGEDHITAGGPTASRGIRALFS